MNDMITKQVQVEMSNFGEFFGELIRAGGLCTVISEDYTAGIVTLDIHVPRCYNFRELPVIESE